MTVIFICFGSIQNVNSLALSWSGPLLGVVPERVRILAGLRAFRNTRARDARPVRAFPSGSKLTSYSPEKHEHRHVKAGHHVGLELRQVRLRSIRPSGLGRPQSTTGGGARCERPSRGRSPAAAVESTLVGRGRKRADRRGLPHHRADEMLDGTLRGFLGGGSHHDEGAGAGREQEPAAPGYRAVEPGCDPASSSLFMALPYGR